MREPSFLLMLMIPMSAVGAPNDDEGRSRPSSPWSASIVMTGHASPGVGFSLSGSPGLRNAVGASRWSATVIVHDYYSSDREILETETDAALENLMSPEVVLGYQVSSGSRQGLEAVGDFALGYSSYLKPDGKRRDGNAFFEFGFGLRHELADGGGISLARSVEMGLSWRQSAFKERYRTFFQNDMPRSSVAPYVKLTF